MLELIKEIESALDNNLIRCALGMALTLPDICGKVGFPEYKDDSKKRYEEWCNKYLFNQGFYPTHIMDLDNPDRKGERSRVISGNLCYKLRCAYLHSGNLQLNQRPNDDYPQFLLRISTSKENGIYVGRDSKDDVDKITQKVIDARLLTRVLCNAAMEFYNNYNDKKAFQNHRIVITDVEKEMAAINTSRRIFAQRQNNKGDIAAYDELGETAKTLLEMFREGKKDTIVEMMDHNCDVVMAIFELLEGGFVVMDSPT